MDNKQIAKHALGFIGGKPTVNRYSNSGQDKSVDIMCCQNSDFKEIKVYSSIGLWELDGGVKHDDKSVRIELIGVAPNDSDYMGNIIASSVFEILDNRTFAYGQIIPNVVNAYVSGTELKHAVLLAPVYWDAYTALGDNNLSVSWLMLVPISDKEKEYIHINGIDAFENKLASNSFDIIDFRRRSVV